MAKAQTSETNGTVDPAAPYGYKADGTPRLRAVSASGTRTRKPVTVLARVQDANGNPVEGAKLDVVIATNDSDKLLEAMDANPGIQRFKITFNSTDVQ